MSVHTGLERRTDSTAHTQHSELSEAAMSGSLCGAGGLACGLTPHSHKFGRDGFASHTPPHNECDVHAVHVQKDEMMSDSERVSRHVGAWSSETDTDLRVDGRRSCLLCPVWSCLVARAVCRDS